MINHPVYDPDIQYFSNAYFNLQTIHFRIVVKYSYFMLTAIVFESHKSNETSKERPELFFFM